MTTTQDFNYKIALASGLRELQAGRLEKAEQQFRFLCLKFATAPGGYRGLAKIRLEQLDRPGALTILRDGAAKLAKAGEHAGVISLLSEALTLDALDLAAHRRLAAAHALAGEMDAACAEYERYARAISATDPAGAVRETRYGLDSLGPQPALLSLARQIGIEVGSPVAPPSEPSLPPLVDPRLGLVDPLQTAPPAADAHPEPAARSRPAEVPQRARVPEPPLDENEDPLAADERAAHYIAAKDPRAAQAALVAARHFIADGRINAASDLLLQLIASGLADHQAQRLLVDVVSSIGKRDVARAKCALLAQALRLDGQNELAVEVERLAQAV